MKLVVYLIGSLCLLVVLSAIWFLFHNSVSKHIDHVSEFTFADTHSTAKMSMGEQWRVENFENSLQEWRSVLLFRFVSESGDILAVSLAYEGGVYYHAAVTKVGMKPLAQWSMQFADYNVRVDMYESSFVAITDSFICGDVYVVAIIESNFRASREDVQKYIESLDIRCGV